MAEYSALLAHSMLRQRAWLAENAARIETQLASVTSEFMANMSQELRTPLNTVVSLASLLSEHQRRRVSDGKIVEYAELIGEAAAHLLCIINDVQDMSHMHSGTFALDAREVDIDALLQGAMASLRPTAFEVGVALNGEFDGNLPPLTGDAGKLRRMFSGLIGNAVRFTPRGGTVRVATRALEDGSVAIQVRDSGAGMTPEEIALALTPFARADGGGGRWREGSGLDLPIARALAGLHGGSLEIESSQTAGTEVRVILPVRAAQYRDGSGDVGRQ